MIPPLWQQNPRPTPVHRGQGPASAWAFLRALGLWGGTLGLLLVLAACGSDEAPAAPPYAGSIAIQAPVQAPAGQPLTIDVAADAPGGTPVYLVTTGTFGSLAYTLPLQDGAARFILSADDTRRSGLVTLTARIGEAETQAQVRLNPGPPVEPLTALVGARSITADGGHWAMVVTIPFDELGNPVDEGTPVQVRALHPGDRLEMAVAPVTHLLSWFRLYSGTQAGRTTVAVQSGDAYGPEKELMEVPGWPVPFPLYPTPVAMPGDGRLLLTLRTGNVTDRFGNQIPDGTAITFLIEDPEGKRRWIPGYTVDGAAEVTIQAAGEPVGYRVLASVFGVESETVGVNFTPGPAVGTFPLFADFSPETGALFVHAGPILGPLKQYVPDGTLAEFEIRDSLGRVQLETGVVDAGYAQVEVRLISLNNGHYTVHALAGSGQGEITFYLEDLPPPADAAPLGDQTPTPTPVRRIVIEEASTTSDQPWAIYQLVQNAAATPSPGPTVAATGSPASVPTQTVTPIPTPTLTLTPTPTPTLTPTASPTLVPTPVVLSGRVNAAFGLNVRAAPRADADLAAVLRFAEVVTLVGRTGDGQWLQILVEKADGPVAAWVVAEFVDIINAEGSSGETDTLPVIDPGINTGINTGGAGD